MQFVVFCVVIGMFFVMLGMVLWYVLIGGIVGIWLLVGVVFVINCFVEQKIDVMMCCIVWCLFVCGEIMMLQILLFLVVFGSVGVWMFYMFMNLLMMWLMIVMFVGYVVIYMLLFKLMMLQNIVIGGVLGVMLLVFGWVVVIGVVLGDVWIFVLIIFVWMLLYFWVFVFYCCKDYENVGLLMLFVMYGEKFMWLYILLYMVILFVVMLMFFIFGMSGVVYLMSVVLFGVVFFVYVWKIYCDYLDEFVCKVFCYLIVYLLLLFVVLFVDYYVCLLFGV